MSEKATAGGQPLRRPSGRRRWTSFVADESLDGNPVRNLHEQADPRHRLRVEHDAHTLLIHLTAVGPLALLR